MLKIGDDSPLPDSWSPSSWRPLKAKQQPVYSDEKALCEALATVRRLPPLVVVSEVEELRRQLAEAAQGKRFFLQGGDCAERFVDCGSMTIENNLKILLQMSMVLTWGTRIPTIRVGRCAGQYSKPRSSPTEVVDGVVYPNFRGDNINSFDLSHREPDPRRLVDGYFHAAATLNYCRALVDGGIASLRSASSWEVGFTDDHPTRDRYASMVKAILGSLDFMRACGGDMDPLPSKSPPHFVSHEGLILCYEEAMTRKVGDRHYNLGAHFLWIGDRTRDLDGAHVEYFRGISNPIGIKVGPSLSPEELVTLIRRLWPEPAAAPGKIVLITRLGAANVERLLPGLIKAVQDAELPVLWTCDPMHGNTTTTAAGLKTRRLDDVFEELRASFVVHMSHGSFMGGAHFELTGEDVTECTGGPQRLGELDLAKAYTTGCDPRLNYSQSMEVAFLMAELLQQERERLADSSMERGSSSSVTSASSAASK